MLNIFSKKEKEPQGYIKHFDLKGWWLSSFSENERSHMIEVFQPMGFPVKDALVNGNFEKLRMIGKQSDTPLSFLTNLSGWFDNPRDRNIANIVIAKAGEYVASERNIFALHFFYPTKMKLLYKERENTAALNEAINFCLKQIGISREAADAFQKEYGGRQLPSHEGYEQLCIILEKQAKFDEAIKFAEAAKEQGWSGEWDTRIARCRGKIEKSHKK